MNIDALFEKTHLLPTIPRVVQELIDSFNQEDVDITSIAKKIAVDQVLTAKVLRLANSAHYGSARQVGSVDDAVVVLGFNSLRTLVIASGISGAFAQMPGLDRDAFWHHSLRVGTIAKQLARQCSPKMNQDIAFTAGLMHAIGQLLIHIVFPKESIVIQKASVSAPLQRMHIEQDSLGTDHCQVGAELARRWNFPSDIQQAIAHYTDPGAVSASNKLAALVQVSVHYAEGIESEPALDDFMAAFPMQSATDLGLDNATIVDQLNHLRALSKESDALI